MPWLACATLAVTARGAAPDPKVASFFDNYCFDCHDTDTKKGDLDLTTLQLDPDNAKNFATWVKVHDRLRDHEMPPKKKAQPDAAEAETALKAIADPLIAHDLTREATEGRATWRRLNRYEYENSVRDLLHAPWLQVKEMLPEDGEAFRFNKVGDALDVSHVQMSRYLAAADYALRQVMAKQAERPETKTVRYYARQQRSFVGKMKFSVFNMSSERSTFPMLGTDPQPLVLREKEPVSVGESDPEKRELEAFGVVASSYEPIEIRFNGFKAQVPGHYKLRFNTLTFWAGPLNETKWWAPDRDKTSAGRRSEPVTIYAESPPDLLRRLGAFDSHPEAGVQEVDAWLLAGETIQPDASRLFRSRPPNWHNPLATKDGQPGVAFRWMEAEGPILESWPTAGHKLLFGDLPMKESATGKGVEIISSEPKADSARLLRNFMEHAYRRPVEDTDVAAILPVIQGALDSGSSFADAMIAGYSTVLCSPGFVCVEEKPGRLDDYALAERLSYFLWNSQPDEELRALAAKGELHKPAMLNGQIERLLNDPRSRRFVDAFLDYWLDLRKMDATAPDGTLYPDYYLDDLLTESAGEETRLFFAELLRGNLPARNIVDSKFAMLNERLSEHYGLYVNDPVPTDDTAHSEAPAAEPKEPTKHPYVQGVALRKVDLPAGCIRGGLLTQASVLKVTANGTTTSPVLRGAWIMERILGKRPPPPPPSVPAVEPDTRGATTIREQLDKHRTLETCSVCHAKIDPAGFALESFDVAGGWRDHYRALGEGEKVKGFGKNGQPFTFHPGPSVDASGQLPDGRKFADVGELKKQLLGDERQIARNLTQQLIVFATGAPVSFGDRPEVEQILDHAQQSEYGVRTIVNEIVQSGLFQNK